MLNKVVLMGRLTRDPELRHTPQNTPVASFTLAVDRSFGRGAERETDFIDVVAWQATAEFVSKYFTKGLMVAVVGRLQVRNWTDKDNNKRRTYEVVADEVHFAESKRSAEAGAGGPRPSREYDTPYQKPAPASSDFAEISDEDGDLPF